MPQLNPYPYKVMSVPLTCTTYQEGEIVEMYVPEPPPVELTLGGNTPCTGTTMVLYEE